MSNSPQILTAIVEDDRATREGLSLLINGTDGYKCVGAYRSVEDAMRANTQELDVLLLDINLPGMLGSDGVKLFKQKNPRLQILMLTIYAQQGRTFRHRRFDMNRDSTRLVSGRAEHGYAFFLIAGCQ